jgi:hypothetical protein
MALIALPCPGKPIVPPLTLAYVAALLEQRRHIVRIYDLALDPQTPLAAAFQPLRSFRPQIVVVAGEHEEQLDAAAAVLRAEQECQVLPVQMSRGGLDAVHACATVLSRIDRLPGQRPRGDTAAPPLSLDELPFPARHLLSLESYSLRAVGGELQTTLVVAGLDHSGDQVVMREPAQITAELRGVSHEFGLRHYRITDVPVTIDRPWLLELATRLRDAELGIGWEADADAEQLDDVLIAQMARSGCESLSFHLDAASVFESTTARFQLISVVAVARQQGIFVRAHVKLEPPYESVPALVDVAATFGLDDVRFDVAQADAVSIGADDTQLKAIARQIYDAGRDRQRFVTRFGPALGNLIWKLRGPRTRQSPGLDDDGITA